VFSGKVESTSGVRWGKFHHQHLFDFSEVQNAGLYLVSLGQANSDTFLIDPAAYQNYNEVLISFMQQQRCGYNPYFKVTCHQGDGRLFYGPVPDSIYYDFSGGWHDAGDQLKYLITGSNATARMLLAYELGSNQFGDEVDAYGHPFSNGIPDILDEAKWGLDWILRLHPKSDWLIHQIADDRDHRGFKFPDKDNAEYGWGPNSYRVAYFANGQPQGLGKWKSKATGIANLAGRSAAALALGARIWRKAGLDEVFAARCQKAAEELYALGRQKEGYQQGNSFGAPYRYSEDTWADDMEWGAVELFRLTEKHMYLTDAIKYAYIIQDEGWMAQDSMMHYQKYPFMNMGHYRLYPLVPDSIKVQLANWYLSNIEKVVGRSRTNAFQIGIPFLWCSNNLLVNFITQLILYEEMTGDKQFRAILLLHRDWLFGRNPWGTSMFTGIPAHGEVPEDVHLPATYLLGKTPAGGLVDGPIYRSIHDKLLGLTLNEPDEFSDFQNDHVVYQDDIGDYSTNEPTMDGTADAILMMTLLTSGY
ncbi:MAG: glycoside hydrolase family 9 protein, partial [Saprospiraceae bacterium]|nr:glycoside hydrolase family 9 protein [Saprospiraceae bacterium]